MVTGTTTKGTPATTHARVDFNTSKAEELTSSEKFESSLLNVGLEVTTTPAIYVHAPINLVNASEKLEAEHFGRNEDLGSVPDTQAMKLEVRFVAAKQRALLSLLLHKRGSPSRISLRRYQERVIGDACNENREP
ncbi:hypothetical protein RIF29_29299 [Crotalaria pallida]|uniref:Uncharacterized protein n=1 Tax=Crotalaria pallida TaxID=3830 RepID=A0AAN9EF89_CROPI